jgi:hypothetical protein
MRDHERVKITIVMCVVCLLGACSDSTADPSATTTTVTTTALSTQPQVSAGSGSGKPTVAPQTIPPTDAETAVPSTRPIVPETGVPGLDSPDLFCASWSQWAGSYQVISVTSAFGGGTPADLAGLEVIASTVVVEANTNLLEAWPDEIESERIVGADKLFGPLTRRLTVAAEALESAGADEATRATIRTAWLNALAARDSASPEFTVDLPEEIWAVVDAAGSDFLSRSVPFANDPSLIVEADTQPIDDYIASTCPDQGTLLGAEISG